MPCVTPTLNATGVYRTIKNRAPDDSKVIRSSVENDGGEIVYTDRAQAESHSAKLPRPTSF